MIGPLPYIGGKNRLAKQIIALLPEHLTYVEAFAGGAQVFFHKQPSEVEILNDLDGEVINFFRVCQWHYEELVRYLRFCPPSRKLFELVSATAPQTLTDVQRAARFFYLQKNAFGGLIVKRAFHYGVTQRQNYTLDRIPEALEQAHRRLQRVQLESLPYEKILEKYDRTTTLFYLDPPYWQRKLYKFNFRDEDFEQLNQRLQGLKGRFVLSLDDHPEIRRIFRAWRIQRAAIHYTAQRKAGKRFGELLIMNFEPEKRPVEAETSQIESRPKIVLDRR
ncbi:MAG: DNA adenine methylase [Bryobacteraceae bacterium]|jgi:DNA adenine methylase